MAPTGRFRPSAGHEQPRNARSEEPGILPFRYVGPAVAMVTVTLTANRGFVVIIPIDRHAGGCSNPVGEQFPSPGRVFALAVIEGEIIVQDDWLLLSGDDNQVHKQMREEGRCDF